MLKSLACLAMVLAASTAQAQYTIQSPGQPPTFVNPLGNDRYIIQSPGQSPTFVNPTGNGGYIVRPNADAYQSDADLSAAVTVAVQK